MQSPHTPHPLRPPYPPRPGQSPGESDRELVARLGGSTPDARSVALLMARHWPAVHDYAVICLASPATSATMATATAFHQVLGRAGGGALRPQLLAAVRDTVKHWAADDTLSAMLPELRKTTGARGLRAARPATPERRRLAERAFLALPGASQCLLWHTEVEAEPISVPAGLLAVDTARASAALEQAREQFRAGCARAHRELAPTRECRFHNRLLDVPIRRGGDLLPDVQRHLGACRYCRHAAEQLSHFDGGLEVLLAETVLGWGARRYLDSRPGRDPLRPTRAAHPEPWQRTGGPLRSARRPARTVLVGTGLTTLALLATVFAARGWSDNGVPGPRPTWGAVSGSSVTPKAPAPGTGPTSPSAASADRPVEIGHGRLRSRDAGLCLDLRGGRAVDGAATVLATCSSSGSQQWTYQDDGLLRSGADPTLCLDADTEAAADTVVLADCLVHAGEVRYDLTLRGELLLRHGDGLLLAPGPKRTVVITERDGSVRQRWLLDAGGEAAGTTRGDGLPGRDGSRDAPSDGRTGSAPAPTSTPLASTPGPDTPDEGAAPFAPAESSAPQDPQGRYETRAAPADHGAQPEPEPLIPGLGAGALGGDGAVGLGVGGIGSGFPGAVTGLTRTLR